MAEGPIATEIRQLLTESLAPERLEIEDDSARHAGHHTHGGVDGHAGGESHFNLTVVAQAFEGQSRLSRQRMVTEPLRGLLAGPVHALSIRAMAPAESSG